MTRNGHQALSSMTHPNPRPLVNPPFTAMAAAVFG